MLFIYIINYYFRNYITLSIDFTVVVYNLDRFRLFSKKKKNNTKIIRSKSILKFSKIFII